MTEYWFYHLEAASLEAVLPNLLEKTLAKGWTSLVKMPSEKLDYFEKYLWSFRDDSFLPHGLDTEPQAELQPVLLSSTADEAAGRNVVFLVDNSHVTNLSGVSRVMVMIDGRSESNIQQERKRWSELKKAGAQLQYWQQTASGKWEKRA